eukprot:c47737_g1_i1 orf=1-1635(+)
MAMAVAMAGLPNRKSTNPPSLPAFLPRIAVVVAVSFVAAIVAAFRFRKQRSKKLLPDDGDAAVSSPELAEAPLPFARDLPCSNSQLGDRAVQGLGPNETLQVEAPVYDLRNEDGEVGFSGNAGMMERNGSQSNLSATQSERDEASFTAVLQQCSLGDKKMDFEICPQVSECIIDWEESPSVVQSEGNTIAAKQSRYEHGFSKVRGELLDIKIKPLATVDPHQHGIIFPTKDTGNSTRSVSDLKLDLCSTDAKEEVEKGATKRDCQHVLVNNCSELKTEQIRPPDSLAERPFVTGTAAVVLKETCQLITALGESDNLLDVELQGQGFNSGKSSSESQCSQISDTALLIASPLTVNLARKPPPEEDEGGLPPEKKDFFQMRTDSHSGKFEKLSHHLVSLEESTQIQKSILESPSGMEGEKVDVNTQIQKTIIERPSGVEGEKVDLCLNDNRTTSSEQAGNPKQSGLKLELCETSQSGKKEDPVQFSGPVVIQQDLNQPAFMTIWEWITFKGSVFLSVKNVIFFLLIGILSIALCYMWGGWKHPFPS